MESDETTHGGRFSHVLTIRGRLPLAKVRNVCLDQFGGIVLFSPSSTPEAFKYFRRQVAPRDWLLQHNNTDLFFTRYLRILRRLGWREHTNVQEVSPDAATASIVRRAPYFVNSIMYDLVGFDIDSFCALIPSGCVFENETSVITLARFKTSFFHAMATVATPLLAADLSSNNLPKSFVWYTNFEHLQQFAQTFVKFGSTAWTRRVRRQRILPSSRSEKVVCWRGKTPVTFTGEFVATYDDDDDRHNEFGPTMYTPFVAPSLMTVFDKIVQNSFQAKCGSAYNRHFIKNRRDLQSPIPIHVVWVMREKNSAVQNGERLVTNIRALRAISDRASTFNLTHSMRILEHESICNQTRAMMDADIVIAPQGSTFTWMVLSQATILRRRKAFIAIAHALSPDYIWQRIAASIPQNIFFRTVESSDNFKLAVQAEPRLLRFSQSLGCNWKSVLENASLFDACPDLFHWQRSPWLDKYEGMTYNIHANESAFKEAFSEALRWIEGKRRVLRVRNTPRIHPRLPIDNMVLTQGNGDVCLKCRV